MTSYVWRHCSQCLIRSLGRVDSNATGLVKNGSSPPLVGMLALAYQAFIRPLRGLRFLASALSPQELCLLGSNCATSLAPIHNGVWRHIHREKLPQTMPLAACNIDRFLHKCAAGARTRRWGYYTTVIISRSTNCTHKAHWTQACPPVGITRRSGATRLNWRCAVRQILLVFAQGRIGAGAVNYELELVLNCPGVTTAVSESWPQREGFANEAEHTLGNSVSQVVLREEILAERWVHLHTSICELICLLVSDQM